MRTGPSAQQVAISPKVKFASSGASEANNLPVIIAPADGEATIIGVGRGSLNLPGQFFKANDKLLFKAAGTFECDDVDDDIAFRIKLKLSDVTFLSVTTPVLNPDDNQIGWEFSGEIWCPTQDYIRGTGWFDTWKFDLSESLRIAANDGVSGQTIIDTDAVIEIDCTVEITGGTSADRRVNGTRFELIKVPRP